MNPLRSISGVLLLLLFSAVAASAQIGVYAGFSAANPSLSGAVYGPLVGVYAQAGHLLALGADIRASFLGHDGNRFYTGAVGPRFAIKPPVLPIKPYAEALVGIGSAGNGGSNSTHLNYQIVVGVDATILPRIDWRVVEYDYSALVNNSSNASIFTTGLVIRLP